MRGKNSFIADRAFTRLRVNDYDDISHIYEEAMGQDIGKILAEMYSLAISTPYKKQGALRILDLGCGTGSFLLHLARKYPKAQFYGIDLSVGQIRQAKTLAQVAGKNISYCVGDVSKITYPDKFDVVTMNLDALNHLNQPVQWRRLFKQVYKSLKKDGVFLFDMNTQKRLTVDFAHPEVIIKPDVVYIQCPRGLKEGGGFVFRPMVQVYFRRKGQRAEYVASTEQIAPSKSLLWSMLKSANFLKVQERKLAQKFRAKHMFLQNRVFVTATK